MVRISSYQSLSTAESECSPNFPPSVETALYAKERANGGNRTGNSREEKKRIIQT